MIRAEERRTTIDIAVPTRERSNEPDLTINAPERLDAPAVFETSTASALTAQSHPLSTPNGGFTIGQLESIPQPGPTAPTAAAPARPLQAELKLANDPSELKARYDVVVIGSGYGGAVPAMMHAQAGHSVVVLERGREMQPGDYPEKLTDFGAALQSPINPLGYVRIEGITGGRNTITTVQFDAMGGGSNGNAGVFLLSPKTVIEDPKQGYAPGIYPALQKKFAELAQIMGAQVVPEKLIPAKSLVHKKSVEAYNLTEAGRAKPLTYETVPITVQMDDGANPVDVFQRGCTHCGNCFPGCNVGAKHTLNNTVHQLSKRAGAEFYEATEVTGMRRNADGSLTVDMLYRYGPNGLFRKKKQVRADMVYVAAGVLGTQKILQHIAADKKSGIAISDRLGSGVSTNGDLLGVQVNGDDKSTTNGNPYSEAGIRSGPGPLVVSTALRVTDDGRTELQTQDATIGSAFRSVATPLIKVASLVSAVASGSLRQMKKALDHPADRATLMLGFGAEDESKLGKFVRNRLGGYHIEIEDYDKDVDISQTEDAQRALAQANGANYMPLRTEVVTGKVLSTHTLGGALLGQVTDSYGKLAEGVAVTDGSVHGPIGTNPSATIASFAGLAAERGIAYVNQRKGRPTNVLSFRATPRAEVKDIASPVAATGDVEPAIAFNEKGIGTAMVDGKKTVVELHLSIRADDTDAWMADPNHRMRSTGRMRLGNTFVPIEGSLQLLRKDGDRAFLVYEYETVGDAQPAMRFTGSKEILHNSFLDGIDDFSDVRGRLEPKGGTTSGIDAFYDNPTASLRFPGNWATWISTFHFKDKHAAAGLASLVLPQLAQYLLPIRH